MCSSDDLKELSLTLGPRKKLIQFISDYGKRKQVQEVHAVWVPLGKSIEIVCNRAHKLCRVFFDLSIVHPLFVDRQGSGRPGHLQTWRTYCSLLGEP